MFFIQVSALVIKMSALRILSLLLLYSFLQCHGSENRTNTSNIAGKSLISNLKNHVSTVALPNRRTETSVLLSLADECLQALGISDGTIKDNQLIAPTAFDDDFKTFGPQRARLNMTGGFRANPEHAASAWMKVEIGHIVVLTAIATQGYGDEPIAEWLTSYMLLYSQGTDYYFFKTTNGDIQVRSDTISIDSKLCRSCHSFSFFEESLTCFYDVCSVFLIAFLQSSKENG